MAQEETILLSFAGMNLPLECAQGCRLAVTAKTETDQKFTEIGQTETLSGIAPKFERHILIILRLDLNQQLKLILLVDQENEVIKRELGHAYVNLLALLRGPDPIAIPLTLDYPQKLPQPSMILASVSQPGGFNVGTVFHFNGRILELPDLIPAPYFVLELISNNEDKCPILLYRSEFVLVDKNANPKWREFLLPSRLFPSSAEWSLRISCFNFNFNRTEDLLIGATSISLYKLLKYYTPLPLRQNHNKEPSASIKLVVRAYSYKVPSLVNCLKSDLQFHPTIAIDFTSNNGEPNDPNGLHNLHSMNAYMNAISVLTTALSRIEKLGRISMLGFGAKTPPNYQFSNLFALNGSLDSPHVRSAKDAIHHYQNSAMSLRPYAPTQFSEVIHHIIKLAKAAQRTKAKHHFVLAILTNGQLKDQRDSIDTIVEASSLPISILFIPIGNQKHPAGMANLRTLSLSTLKSSKNVALQRETATVLSASDPALVQQMMQAIGRQLVLHRLRNEDILGTQWNFGQWHIQKVIGRGAHGAVGLASCAMPGTKKRKIAALKVERNDSFLRRECYILSELQKEGGKHFCELLDEGRIKYAHFYVMTLLNFSLKKLKTNQNDKKFSEVTTLKIGVQLMAALERMHKVGFVHRDVKPANMAPGHECPQMIYLFDFGLARLIYKDETKKVLRDPRPMAQFHGSSYDYCSLSAQKNNDQGRVDDLWSVLYCLFEFCIGQLPWAGKSMEAKEKMKQNVELFQQCPLSFKKIDQRLRRLGFADEPDYERYRGWMLDDLKKRGVDPRNPNNDKFEWEGKERQHDAEIKKINDGQLADGLAFRELMEGESDLWSDRTEISDLSGSDFYEALANEYLLPEEELWTNGYPRWVKNGEEQEEFEPDKINSDTGYSIAERNEPTKRRCVEIRQSELETSKGRGQKQFVSDKELKRVCSRCGVEYLLTKDGNYAPGISSEDCIYHWGRAWKKRTDSTVDTRYTCCDSPAGDRGCVVATRHITQSLRMSTLAKYVESPRPFGVGDPRSKKVYALDCEMIYCVWGPEVARISMVDVLGELVLDEFVRPEFALIDCNTKFSGLTEEQINKAPNDLKKAQERLFELVNSETILIGHSLESDLRALRIVHKRVVDTSVVFPHQLGLPQKRALKSLATEFLQLIIQEDETGHDSKEDAKACMRIMLNKVRKGGAE